MSAGATATVTVTLHAAAAARQSVEVRESATAVEEASVASTSVAGEETKTLPTRPATVSDVLPLQRPASSARRRADCSSLAAAGASGALVVNFADVTDPATGQFGLTVPIDSVQNLNFYQTSFLAEYGRFTAGLASVETRRGGDKWKWELNDPLPEFNIRSWHLRGLRTATPRVNFEGPSFTASSTSARASNTRSARRRFSRCPSRSTRRSRRGSTPSPSSTGSSRTSTCSR